MQGCDDQLGNIGIFLQQLIGEICLISCCFFHFRLPFLKEIFVHLLCKTPATLVMGMGIEVCYHPCLGVPSIALNGLDVAAADLQLQRGAAMAQAVEYYWTQIMLSDKLSQQSGDLTLFIWPPIVMRDGQAVIGIFITN